jgi:hypothetical protein
LKQLLSGWKARGSNGQSEHSTHFKSNVTSIVVDSYFRLVIKNAWAYSQIAIWPKNVARICKIFWGRGLGVGHPLEPASRDRWRGLLSGLLRWQLDLLSDHSIKLYAQHIASAANDELAALSQGRREATSEKFVIPDQADREPCSESTPS